MIYHIRIGCLAVLLAWAGMSVPAAGLPMRDPKPGETSSFVLGGSRGAICSAQAADTDPALRTMFDRAYAIVCRDAAQPVAHIYALDRKGDDPSVRLAGLRSARVACGAVHPSPIDDLGPVQTIDCTLKDVDIRYRVYSWTKAHTLYVAEGLTGYDSALKLGLRTLALDRIVKGDVSVATTESGDPAAFARVQAGTLTSSEALAEGYRRNNSGDYAEASEFFVTMLQRDERLPDLDMRNEFLLNRALQLSNLGDFAEADTTLDRARALPISDPLQLRLRRNFIALHLLNQHRLEEALAELDRPIAPLAGTAGVGGASAGTAIDDDTAARVNAGSDLASRFGEQEELTPAERAQVLDAQAMQLRGTVLCLKGDLAGADAALAQALIVSEVHGGHARITARLDAQILAEQSRIAEARGDLPHAEALIRQSQQMLDLRYAGTAAATAGKARLASFLARHGRDAEALAMFREVVVTNSQNPSVTAAMLAPYFDLLVRQMPSHPELAADIFLASETLARPGVANTQAVLARELSGGSDEAARLFRLSVTLAREIERTRIQLGSMRAAPSMTAEDQQRAAALQKTLDTLSEQQTGTQAKLADYPQYRAISSSALSLSDLQKVLHPDEAYLKLTVVENAVYAVYVTPDGAYAYRAGIAAADLEKRVQALRDTIVVTVNGQSVTYPFDLKLARSLYVDLMQPIADRLARQHDLIFEPDGGMLRLPANLLVTDQASVDAYYARVARPNADEYDFRGVHWLGRELDVTTAVSASAFRDVRESKPSAGKYQYLGLGQNAPVSPFLQLTSTRAQSTVGLVDCDYPLSTWNYPIPATELLAAQSVLGRKEANVVTGGQFSDTAIEGMAGLDQYRVLHFATHGLVSAPAAACPAQPALLTSFGTGTSDGLLTFREIYDLHIDADLVILSACNTASAASVQATRAAGIASGGGYALDGLVRAFVGAGGRTVVASHWPVPDDYRATEHLISGLFQAPEGMSVGDALRTAQIRLMDSAETSHPYYWSAFAIVGDGAKPLVRKQ